MLKVAVDACDGKQCYRASFRAILQEASKNTNHTRRMLAKLLSGAKVQAPLLYPRFTWYTGACHGLFIPET